MSDGSLTFSAPGPGALPAGLLWETAQHWRQVHNRLAQAEWQEYALPGLVGLAAYQYCAFKAFGQVSAAELAQRLFARITARWEEAAAWPSPLPASTLDQAQGFAWLSARFAAEGFAQGAAPAQLVALDHALGLEAQWLCQNPAAEGRSNYLRILRYLGLRRPSPSADALLSLVLLEGLRPTAPGQARAAGWPTQMPLGLVNGVAAELLVLMKQCRPDGPNGLVEPHVRRHLQFLLSARQEADFQEQRYAIFPGQVHQPSHTPCFGPELSLQQGDLGQALLLYEAQQWLHDEELGKIAELVGLNTLLRTPAELPGLAGSQLGHGTAGLAHLYGKLYRLANHPAYRQGQLFWLAETQQRVRQELAIGFYQELNTDILDGLPGVGLVLLSALAKNELGWDEIIL